MGLDIRTAAEVIALDLEGRGAARRAARETELLQRVLRAFVERPGSVLVDGIVSAFPGRPPRSVFEALMKLDEEDLVRIDSGRVDLAYPFSASPTSFRVDLGDGRGDRYVCCAVDALGIAPMLGCSVRIRSQCHHCGGSMELLLGPSGPEVETRGVMVWAGERVEDDRRDCDSL